jgi:hypothetical protein
VDPILDFCHWTILFCTPYLVVRNEFVLFFCLVGMIKPNKMDRVWHCRSLLSMGPAGYPHVTSAQVILTCAARTCTTLPTVASPCLCLLFVKTQIYQWCCCIRTFLYWLLHTRGRIYKYNDTPPFFCLDDNHTIIKYRALQRSHTHTHDTSMGRSTNNSSLNTIYADGLMIYYSIGRNNLKNMNHGST